MKLKYLGCLAFLAGLFGTQEAAAQTSETTEEKTEQLRIMTYNIRNGMGEDNVTDYDRVAEVINDKEVQFVAVQEVDSMTKRSNRRYVLQELAKRTNMHATFGPAIPYDGGKYGIGVLSKEKPLSVRQIALPGREERRTMLIVEFEQFVLANMHLSLTPKDREKSVHLVMDEAKRWDKPFIIAGDWNDHPESPVLEKLTKRFTLVNEEGYPTYPASNPTECIDYIGLYEADEQPVSFIGFYVVDAPYASDHRPLLSIWQLESDK